MQTVAIIDYGSGNLHSAAKAFERAAADRGLERRILVTAQASDVAAADRIVLPGVGAFADCKAGLAALPGMIDTLERVVRQGGQPFLGICVGMQLLATRGLEFDVTDGLDWIPGEVCRINPAILLAEGVTGGGAKAGGVPVGPLPQLKVPHMGWNTLRLTDLPSRDGRASERAAPAWQKLLAGIETGPTGQHAYFVHSYHLAAANRHDVVAETDYGGAITAMVARDSIAGVQFHPEKSQALGLTLIGNFLTWSP